MTLAILASSLLLILLGSLILLLPPLALAAVGVALVGAGAVQQGCPSHPAVDAGGFCTMLGPDLAPPLFVFGALFLVPAAIKAAFRRGHTLD